LYLFDKVRSKEATDTFFQNSAHDIMSDGRGYYQDPNGDYYQTDGDGKDANSSGSSEKK